MQANDIWIVDMAQPLPPVPELDLTDLGTKPFKRVLPSPEKLQSQEDMVEATLKAAADALGPVSEFDASNWGTKPLSTEKREIFCHQCSKQFNYDDEENKFINNAQYENSCGSPYQVNPGFEIVTAKFPVLICNTCIKSIPSERITHINCVVCSQAYDEVDGFTQANNCASVLLDRRLTCHYGSAHDFLQYTWINDATFPGKNLDPICDTCIDGWLKNGDIRCGGSYNWTDPFNLNSDQTGLNR